MCWCVYETSVCDKNENGAWQQRDIPVNVGATSVVSVLCFKIHKKSRSLKKCLLPSLTTCIYFDFIDHLLNETSFTSNNMLLILNIRLCNTKVNM